MQAELDELIRALEGARDNFIGIAQLERESGPADAHGTAANSVDRLLDRY